MMQNLHGMGLVSARRPAGPPRVPLIKREQDNSMRLWELTRRTASNIAEDQVLTHAAALAFYTALSLPPLLVLLIWILGSFSEAIEHQVAAQAAALVGPEGERLVKAILKSSERSVSLRGFSGWLGLGALCFAASGVFAQLQAALNQVWGVGARPGSGLGTWARKRFLSLGLVGVLAFLVAVSLVASALVETMATITGEAAWIQGLNFASSLAVFTLLFAAVFKFLPDAIVAWRDALAGAGVTALLFSITKHLIGYYLAEQGLGRDYGAAGSAIVVLAWVYLNGAVLLIGAEVTQTWATSRGRRIKPNEHAIRVELVELPGADAPGSEAHQQPAERGGQ